eukprot:m.86980 g.86980  ORF g.86980 m.86980 type:complete len:142 (-) comp11509_c0_seq1:518-943(-)
MSSRSSLSAIISSLAATAAATSLVTSASARSFGVHWCNAFLHALSRPLKALTLQTSYLSGVRGCPDFRLCLQPTRPLSQSFPIVHEEIKAGFDQSTACGQSEQHCAGRRGWGACSGETPQKDAVRGKEKTAKKERRTWAML